MNEDDILRIEICLGGRGFIRKPLSKILTKIARKKLGVNDILVDMKDLAVTTENELRRYRLHVDCDILASKEDLAKLADAVMQ